MNSVTQLPLWGTVEIPLTRGYVTVVDAVDGDLMQFKWRVIPKSGGRFYASRGVPSLMMHRIILGRVLGRILLSNEQVDHVDRDGLNNRRENLRLSTPAQNQQNQRRHIDSTTGYKGVRYNKGKWMARISVNKVRVYLGVFETPEAAYAAYCDAAKKYHGEFARLE